MAKAGVIFIGTQAGLEVWSDPGGSGRWRRRISTLSGVPITAIAALDALTLTVAAPGSSLISRDGGLNWQEAAAADPAGVTVAELALAGLPPTQLRLGAAGIERRDDAADAWMPVLSGDITVLHAVGYHQDSVWAGAADGGFWLSSNRGRSWQAVGTAAAAVSALCAVRLI
jgi:hypothetical protein